MNQQWWAAFGPAETSVSCSDAKHRLRWADGMLQAVDHPDAEGELVLAALGGDTSPCLDIVRAWGQHSDDLTVLAVGPRSASDAVTIPAAVLDEVNTLSDPTGQGYHGLGNPVAQRRTYGHSGVGVVGTSAMIRAHRPGRAGRSPIPPKVLRQAALRRARMRARSGGWTGYAPLRRANLFSIGWPGAEVDQARIELIRLLALGAPFQYRLSAAVAHAWSVSGDRADRWQQARPGLTAALAGRLAPAAGQWLGIDPGEIDVTIQQGAGWGEITQARDDGNARLRAKLPVGWLSEVWAPGFAAIDSHLVVALIHADWPEASVLALREPGQNPVELSIRQDQGHWSVTSR